MKAVWRQTVIIILLIAAAALSVSAQASKPVTWVDTSYETYDKKVLMIDDEPFFFNAVHIRREKIRDAWHWSDEEIKRLYTVAKDDGFTAVVVPIWWNEIQPDLMYPPATTGYYDPETGSVADVVYTSFEVKPDSTAYIRYADYQFCPDDTAILRLYVQGVTGHFPVLDVYALEDTLVYVGSIMLDGPHFYDLDVSSYLRSRDGNSEITFLLMAGEGSTGRVRIDRMPVARTQGLNYIEYTQYLYSLSPNVTAFPPTLRISRPDRYDWAILDQMIKDVEEAGLKLVLLWMGSDTTNLSQDNRLPAYVLANYQKTVKRDGEPVMQKQSASTWLRNGVYHYHLDKCDLDLRAKEKQVIKDVFDHIAELDAAAGHPRTVIGCQVNNETNVPTRLEYRDRSYSHWANQEWEARGFTDWQEFYFTIRAEWFNELAAGVKESNYPVWTRANNAEFLQYGQPVTAHGVRENEHLRQTTGTNLDFIGPDFYRYSELEQIYHMLLGPYSLGGNLAMVMETDWTLTGSAKSGQKARIPDYGIILTYAANAHHTLYDLMGPDGHNFYIQGPNRSIVPGGIVNDASIQKLQGQNSLGLVIAKIASGHPALAIREFDQTEGIIEITTKLSLSNNSSSWQGPTIHDAQGRQVMSFAFENSRVRALIGQSAYQVLPEYQAGTWYELRIVIDTVNQACSLWINGQPKLFNFKLPEPVGSIAGISWAADMDTAGILEIAYLKVTARSSQSDEAKTVIDDRFNTGAAGTTPAGWQLECDGRQDWVEDTRSTNHMLAKIWYDLATKATDGAGGTDLVFFNQFAEYQASVAKPVHGYLFRYDTENRGVGIAVFRGEKEFVLASKTESIFTVPVDLTVESAEAGYYDQQNQWVALGLKEFSETQEGTVIVLQPYEVVRLLVK